MDEHNRGAASRVVSKPAKTYLTPNGRSEGVPVLRQTLSPERTKSVIFRKVLTPREAFSEWLQAGSGGAKQNNVQPAPSVEKVGGVGDKRGTEPARLVAPGQSALPSNPGTTTAVTGRTPKSSKEDPRRSGPIAAKMTRATEAPVGSSALLTEKDVAAMLNLEPATLRNWRVRGEGPPFVRLSRRAIRYSRADVSEWLASRTRRSTSATEVNHG